MKRLAVGGPHQVDRDLGHLELQPLGALGLVANLLERAVERHRPSVDVAQQQLLFKGRGVREDLAAGPEDDAVAVEDQLVLAADRVDVDDVRAVVGRALGDHLLALDALAGVERRAVDVDQHLGAVLGLPCHRAGRIPAVLADGDADLQAALVDDRAAVADGEITLLVEDAVVRQEHLVVDGLQLAVADVGGGVEDLAVLVYEADDHRDAFRGGHHLLQVLEVVAHE